MRVRKLLPEPLLPKTPLEAFDELLEVQADAGVLHVEGAADPDVAGIRLIAEDGGYVLAGGAVGAREMGRERPRGLGGVLAYAGGEHGRYGGGGVSGGAGEHLGERAASGGDGRREAGVAAVEAEVGNDTEEAVGRAANGYERADLEAFDVCCGIEPDIEAARERAADDCAEPLRGFGFQRARRHESLPRGRRRMMEARREASAGSWAAMERQALMRKER